MIHILFFIESLSGGGAEKVLRDLVNAMDQTKFSVTVQTLYPEDAEKYLAPGIRYKYCYPARSRSNDLRMRAEAALGLTYPLHIKGGYDVEAAYLECGSTKIMAGSTNQKALKLAWVHCDLAKKRQMPQNLSERRKSTTKNTTSQSVCRMMCGAASRRCTARSWRRGRSITAMTMRRYSERRICRRRRRQNARWSRSGG